MAREVEHKYRVTSDGWRAQAEPGISYRQGYLSTDPERSVRIRIAGDRGYLTIKGRSEGASRDEFEYPVPLEDARELLKLCAGPLIEKTRHIVRDGPFKWEIDEFAGANRGLVVAEIETEAQQIPKPDWAGEEVTGDERYYNLSLVRRPYSDWEKEK